MTPDPSADGAYAGFGGHVGRTFGSSTPWWPSRPLARERAPNVVLVLADDLGFSDLGCFGSEIATPSIDGIAAGGLRYANFHVTPLCSPTRAALLTGINSHAAGVGLVANADPGFPGYTGQLPANQPSLAELFRANGYSTLAIGKWHLWKDSDMHEAGTGTRGHSNAASTSTTASWRRSRTSIILTASSRAIAPSTSTSTRRGTTSPMTSLIEQCDDPRGENGEPNKAVFSVLRSRRRPCPAACEAEDIARQAGNYAIGWDQCASDGWLARSNWESCLRERSYRRGNPEPGEDVVAWDTLSDEDQRLFARYMEVYAAMVESVDQSVGRLRAALEELGEWENTVFLFASDNGASREGRNAGGASYFYKSPGTLPGNRDIRDYDRESYDVLGGPTTWPHYPRGWAMACNTPFRLYKVTAFRGGNQVPLVLSWPAEIKRAGEIRHQYQHVTDVLPTLVELLRLDLPTERNGLPARPLAGASFAPTVADPKDPRPMASNTSSARATARSTATTGRR